MHTVTISWHRGLTQTFDRFDVYIGERFIRDFAPNVGREHIQLATGDHVLRIEASGAQEAEQEIPFQVEGDTEIIIKRRLTAVTPDFYLDIQRGER